jgi:hypothetical protein
MTRCVVVSSLEDRLVETLRSRLGHATETQRGASVVGEHKPGHTPKLVQQPVKPPPPPALPQLAEPTGKSSLLRLPASRTRMYK